MYRDPGVYLRLSNNAQSAPNVGGGRIPLIIGSGASVLLKTIVMTRSSSGNVDQIPFDSTAIVSIGYTSDVNMWNATQDYTYDAVADTITWIANKGPTAGQTYSITVKYKPSANQYTPQLLSSVTDVVNFYGPDLKTAEDNSINQISVAAQMALKQGAPAIYVLQVPPTAQATAVVAADYQAALDKYARFIGDLWRIVPADNLTGVNAIIDGHINAMSVPEEKMERSAIYSAEYDTAAVFADIQTKIGAYATSKASKRINVIYPDSATLMFSDGKIRTVGGAVLAAAFAGAETVLSPQNSRTRMPLKGFVQLQGVRMTRTQMNTIASCGVTLLTQATTNADVVVRHQLTTDMSNVQTRETSITDIGDTCAKMLRNSVEQYIGKYNITPDVVTRIDGTLKATIAALKSAGVINDGKINALMQDANNPDTLIVSASVLPPYPCNYIDISLVMN